jgi:hypothetical protein
MPPSSPCVAQESTIGEYQGTKLLKLIAKTEPRRLLQDFPHKVSNYRCQWKTTIRCPGPNLDYDTSLGGYRVDITEEQLKGAPNFSSRTDWDWSDRSRDFPSNQ